MLDGDTRASYLHDNVHMLDWDTRASYLHDYINQFWHSDSIHIGMSMISGAFTQGAVQYGHFYTGHHFGAAQHYPTAPLIGSSWFQHASLHAVWQRAANWVPEPIHSIGRSVALHQNSTLRALLHRPLFWCCGAQRCLSMLLIGSTWFQQEFLHWWTCSKLGPWANLQCCCACFGTNPPAGETVPCVMRPLDRWQLSHSNCDGEGIGIGLVPPRLEVFEAWPSLGTVTGTIGNCATAAHEQRPV